MKTNWYYLGIVVYINKKEKNELSTERPSYDEMNDSTMNDLLIELSGTKLWAAVLRLADIRCAMADNVLRSIDPFKNPTETARNQGFLSGSRDLEVYIASEKEKRKASEGSKDSK